MNKKIYVTKPSLPSKEEYIRELDDIWESSHLTNFGPKHNKLTEELINYLDVKNLELTVNGHTALEIAIQALGLKGEIITTPFTFVSTIAAIERSGCKAVFCDVKEDDYTIDPNKAEELINDKTVAILPVHVYGNVCDIERIDQIAKKHNLKVIYDAAHTFGEKYKGKGIGSYGDVSCFSFHATKVFNTVEGGCICFNDESLKNKISSIKDFGIVDEETVDYIGTNAKMNEFSAAMGLCNLKHIKENIYKRKLIVERYNEKLKDIRQIKLNKSNSDLVSNYAYYPIVLDGYSRDALKQALEDKGIYVRKYFYPCVNDMKPYIGNNKTKIAHNLSLNVLTLPLYADLDIKDVDYICDCIIEKINS